MHLSAYEGHSCLLLQQIKKPNSEQPLLSILTLLYMKSLSIRVIFPDS